jgi:hypothetical protein
MISRFPRRDHSPCELIGVDDHPAQSFQYPRNHAFPRSDPAGQAYDPHYYTSN